MSLNSKPLFIITRCFDAPFETELINKLSLEIEEHLLTARDLLSNESPSTDAVVTAQHHRELAEITAKMRDRQVAMRN